MQIESISYQDVEPISSRDLAYIIRDKNLEKFITAWPDLKNFNQAIENRKKYQTDRSRLISALNDQYENAEVHSSVMQNIEALADERTFCVTTAHQPSLLTGPLYYIYKICSTIHLSNQLKNTYPSYQFVPVFISGGEDHDFEEINHLYVFGKRVEWQREASGPVGRLDLKGLKETIDEVFEILGDQQYIDDITSSIKKALGSSDSYGQFALNYVNELFGEYGLVCLNMDTRVLKETFRPVIKKELFEKGSHQLVSATIDELESIGYKAQATPREINLFYMDDGIRERIIQENSEFEVLGLEKRFQRQEIEKLVNETPEKFSPNVILRPLYQEMILPNLVYIGGGGELAYWVERKPQFEEFGIPFPLLVRRNSTMYFDRSTQKQLKKADITPKDIFKDVHTLINEYVQIHSDKSLNISEEKKAMNNLFRSIAQKAKEIEPPLEKYVLAELANHMKTLDHIENKLLKAEKQKHEIEINRIEKLKEKLFPDQGLQERYENFLSIYLRHGKSYLRFLVDNLDPLRNEFLLILE